MVVADGQTKLRPREGMEAQGGVRVVWMVLKTENEQRH